MNFVAISRSGKSGLDVWHTPIYHAGWIPGPDAAELRDWVVDETELGERVAGWFIDYGRCPLYALDTTIFRAMEVRFPYPENPRRDDPYSRFPDPDFLGEKEAVAECLEARLEWRAKWRKDGRRTVMCPDPESHMQWRGTGGTHGPRPVGEPLSGLFWTCHVRPAPRK